MKRYVFASAMAVVCAGALASAQAPAGQQPAGAGQQTPRTTAPTDTRATSQQAATTTLTGCVYREQDVPGRTPNVAERAGILEDYILATMSPAGQGAAGTPAGTTGTTAGSGATGTTGAGAPAGGSATRPGATAGAGGSATAGAAAASRMYKLEFVDDSRLKALVGKRVEVMGRIDAEAGDAGRPAAGGAAAGAPQDRSAGPDRIELSEFEVTSIKEVPGTCPASPGR